MILYFLFLFLVPFQEHRIMGAQLFFAGPVPITPIKLVGIPLVIAAVVLSRPADAAVRPSTRILALFAAFVLFQLLGTTLSSVSFPATDVSSLFAFAILMLTTNFLISTQDRLRMTVRAIVLVETFASTWLYKQYYILHWPRPIGPSSDPNYEALSLVMTVPLAIWLIQYEERDLWKWIGLICAPILAFAVFVAQSRGGLLALIVMAALAFWNSQHKTQLVVGFVAALVAMLAIGPSSFLDRIEQMQLSGQAQTGAEVSTRSRVELARAGVRMMEAHPVFGVGLDQFKGVEFHYNPVLMVVEPVPHIAHNTYVQLGAEGGLPTLALYLVILGVTVATCRSARWIPGVPEDIGALAFSFQIALIGFMVAEFFLTAQYVKEPWIFVSLAPNLYVIALHAASKKKPNPVSKTPALQREKVAASGRVAG